MTHTNTLTMSCSNNKQPCCSTLAIAAATTVAMILPTFFAIKCIQEKILQRRSRGKRAAVILAGCGYLDGSETTEATAVLISLSELGFETTVFAPEGNQADVVDHQQARALGYAPRNIMQESARLTRGQVQDVAQLKAEDFACLVIPGGFGAAKNLCNWASAPTPAECVVREEVRGALERFAALGKPVALCCIAPVLAAVVYKNVKLTVGGSVNDDAGSWPYAGTAQQVQSLGAQHVDCDVTEVCIDHEHKLVTTPAYMSGTAKRHQVFQGVRKMVRAMAWLLAAE